MDVTLEWREYGKTAIRVYTTYALADETKAAISKLFIDQSHLEVSDSRYTTEDGRNKAAAWLERERDLRR